MIHLNQLLLILISLVIFVGCATSSLSSQYIQNQKITIEKPQITLKNNNLPKTINVIFSEEDNNHSTKKFFEGFSMNYFYYKKLYYIPKINFIELVKEGGKTVCSLRNLSKNYSIVFLDPEVLETLDTECFNTLDKLNGIIVVSNNETRFKNSSLIPFNADRKNDLHSLLSLAKQEGKINSIIIDDLSTNEITRISKIWRELGGKVIDSKTSTGSQNEKLISELLGIEDSRLRSRKLARVLSVPLETIPRRRLDIDSIILSVSISRARSLKPALEYNFGESISVYLLSNWINNETYLKKEIDLEGITVIDMPWVLNASVNELSEKKNTRSRSFAIGYDMFELILLLNNNANQRSFQYTGMSGKISFNQGKLNRKSIKARIEESNYRALGY